MIRWYPEEDLASTKGGRATMIASTLMPAMLALSFFYYLGPPIVAGELDAANFQFTVLFLSMSAWTLLDSQSFLRWMVRNWNTPVDN